MHNNVAACGLRFAPPVRRRPVETEEKNHSHKVTNSETKNSPTRSRVGLFLNGCPQNSDNIVRKN